MIDKVDRLSVMAIAIRRVRWKAVFIGRVVEIEMMMTVAVI